MLATFVASHTKAILLRITAAISLSVGKIASRKSDFYENRFTLKVLDVLR